MDAVLQKLQQLTPSGAILEETIGKPYYEELQVKWKEMQEVAAATAAAEAASNIAAEVAAKKAAAREVARKEAEAKALAERIATEREQDALISSAASGSPKSKGTSKMKDRKRKSSKSRKSSYKEDSSFANPRQAKNTNSKSSTANVVSTEIVLVHKEVATELLLGELYLEGHKDNQDSDIGLSLLKSSPKKTRTPTTIRSHSMNASTSKSEDRTLKPIPSLPTWNASKPSSSHSQLRTTPRSSSSLGNSPPSPKSSPTTPSPTRSTVTSTAATSSSTPVTALEFTPSPSLSTTSSSGSTRRLKPVPSLPSSPTTARDDSRAEPAPANGPSPRPQSVTRTQSASATWAPRSGKINSLLKKWEEMKTPPPSSAVGSKASPAPRRAKIETKINKRTESPQAGLSTVSPQTSSTESVKLNPVPMTEAITTTLEFNPSIAAISPKTTPSGSPALTRKSESLSPSSGSASPSSRSTTRTGSRPVSMCFQPSSKNSSSSFGIDKVPSSICKCGRSGLNSRFCPSCGAKLF